MEEPLSLPAEWTSFLDVSNLTLQYKTAQRWVTATRNVSFCCEEFGRVILLGPSGCGKSTILKAVGGFIKPTGGAILLKGKPVTRPGADRGFVFQEFDQLLPWKTALENVVFAIRSTRKVSRKAAIEEAQALLAKVNLDRFAHTYPHALSGGMKQRVAIARGLALKSEIILMDEPFAALDALTRRKMQDELLELWQENRFTLLFVTHSIDEAITLGTRVVMLSPHPGQVVETLDIGLAAPNIYPPRLADLKERISRALFQNQADYVI